jgi:hypothetical protein
MPPRFTFDSREVGNDVPGLPRRRGLVYRLAVRRLCGRCRGDRRFTERTQAPMQQFGVGNHVRAR